MPSTPTFEELRISDEVHAIIGRRPHGLVRWGNLIFLSVILLLVLLLWLVRYPERLLAPARLRTNTAPAAVQANAHGRLLRIFVGNEEEVKAGQILALIESPTDYAEIKSLQQSLDELAHSFSTDSEATILKNDLPAFGKLGELQSAYHDFAEQYRATREVYASGYYPEKLRAVRKDLALIGTSEQTLLRDKRLTLQDYDLQQKEMRSYETLARQKVIAPLELDGYKSRLIAREQAIGQAERQLSANHSARLEKEKEAMDLTNEMNRQVDRLHTVLMAMRSAIDEWRMKYVLTAPVNGRVLFDDIQSGVLVSEGQRLFVIEQASNALYAELTLGQKGLGNIRSGQTVWLTIESYPAQTYGRLRGTIDYISPLAGASDSFIVRTRIEQRTDRGLSLQLRNGLRADAEIITRNPRLIERIMHPG